MFRSNKHITVESEQEVNHYFHLLRSNYVTIYLVEFRDIRKFLIPLFIHIPRLNLLFSIEGLNQGWLPTKDDAFKRYTFSVDSQTVKFLVIWWVDGKRFSFGWPNDE